LASLVLLAVEFDYLRAATGLVLVEYEARILILVYPSLEMRCGDWSILLLVLVLICC
jgi:hypothetical protein